MGRAGETESDRDYSGDSDGGGSAMNRRMFVTGMMAAGAQAQVGGSVLGFAVDAERRVRPLIGPAGSAYWAQPMAGLGLADVGGELRFR